VVDPLQPDSELGQHQFVLITTLTNYNITLSQLFTVTIDQCIVTGLTVGYSNQTLYNYEILPNPQPLDIVLPPI
jgi:hypothetical protein